MAQQLNPATFPILPVREIVDSCRGYGCPLTEEDLNHPTPARAQSIYEWWMARMLQLNTEDVARAAEQQLDHMEYPEIYREALYIGVFQLAFNQLLVRASIDDFTIRDLTMPTAQRVRHILSGIINFFLFEQEQAAEYLQPLQAEDEDLRRREEELMIKNQEMRDKIDAVKEERRLNAPKVPAVERAVAAGKDEMKLLKMELDKVSKQLEQDKDQLKKLSAETLELSQSNRQQEIEITRLKGQLVASPDRLRTNLVDSAANLAREQEKVRELELVERQMASKISSLQKYEVDLGQCIKILDEWDVDQAKLAEALSRVQKHMDIYESLQSEYAEMENKITIVQRKLKNAQDEYARIDDKRQRKKTAGKQKKKSLEEHYALLLEQKRKLDFDAVQKNRQAADVENKIRELHASVFRELDKGASDYKRIKDQVTLYSNRLNKELDAVNELNMQPLDLSGSR